MICMIRKCGFQMRRGIFGRKRGVEGALSKKCVQFVENWGKSLGESVWKGCGKNCGKMILGGTMGVKWWESRGFARSFTEFCAAICTGLLNFLPLIRREFFTFST